MVMVVVALLEGVLHQETSHGGGGCTIAKMGVATKPKS
jgi:hypothetical protein